MVTVLAYSAELDGVPTDGIAGACLSHVFLFVASLPRYLGVIQRDAVVAFCGNRVLPQYTEYVYDAGTSKLTQTSLCHSKHKRAIWSSSTSSNTQPP